MTSLKSFLPVLSDLLHETPDALYGRQRALMGLEVMDSKPGRGPGSGARLTAKNVAALIISLLAASTLGDVDEQIISLCGAHILEDDKRQHRKLSLHTMTFLEAATIAVGGIDTHKMSWLTAPETIRVTMPWRGQIVGGLRGSDTLSFDYEPRFTAPPDPIRVTREIDELYFKKIKEDVRVAVKIAEYDEDE